MTQDELDKIVEVTIGEKNVQFLIDKGAWQEFSPFDKSIIELHAGAMDCMRYGNLDPKKMMDLTEKFNAASQEFTNRLTFGNDQNGLRVTSEQLFGEIKSARPEYLPYLAAKITLLWAVERKIRLFREEQLEMKTNYEAMRFSAVA